MKLSVYNAINSSDWKGLEAIEKIIYSRRQALHKKEIVEFMREFFKKNPNVQMIGWDVEVYNKDGGGHYFSNTYASYSEDKHNPKKDIRFFDWQDFEYGLTNRPGDIFPIKRRGLYIIVYKKNFDNFLDYTARML